MNKPEYVLVHCSDSPFGDARVIDEWNRGPPLNAKKIAYHWVVLNGRPGPDGSVQKGREENEVGAHCYGFNSKSIGVCVIGKDGDFTPKQMMSLYSLVQRIRKQYGIPVKNVIGHCETRSGQASGKTCPDLDMDLFRQGLGEL